MNTHLDANGEFQSDKYPTCPAGKVPLSTKDPTAQDLLWEYAQRRRTVDPEFSADLETALRAKGYVPPRVGMDDTVWLLVQRPENEPRRPQTPSPPAPAPRSCQGCDHCGMDMDMEPRPPHRPRKS